MAGLPSGPYAHHAQQLGTLVRDFTSAARALGAGTEDILTAVRNALSSGPDTAPAAVGSGTDGAGTTGASVKVTGVRHWFERQT